MKKTFECGHSGKGKYCHRCEQKIHTAGQPGASDQAKKQADAAARASAQSARAAAKQADVISLSALDHLPAVQKKARKIIDEITNGANYTAFHGKRLLVTGSEAVSIPVGNSYRLILVGKPLRPLELISHEAYNCRYGS